ncbi:MAG: ABC transporter permease subunit [Lachnospiraceae bacterium]|nr:ABC transporter permease subunit [Lachnospiraceae bacterium]
MKNNPVYRREMTVRSRSLRMPLIIFAFNGVLALAALLNMYQTIAQVRSSSTIQYSTFLDLYAFVATLEFLLLMFIMPALTSGSISGERERQTLELLFTTKMSPSDIIMGKLLSAVEQLLILVVSSLPIVLLTFVYGSVDFRDLCLLLICFTVVAFYAGGIGILFSSLLRKSTFSNVCTYGVLLFVVVGTYMLNIFLLNLNQIQIGNMVLQPGMERPMADTGLAVMTLLINPVATFAEILGNQVSGGASILSIRSFFGSNNGSFLIRYWIPLSLAVQSAVSFVIIRSAVYCLNPVKNEKK